MLNTSISVLYFLEYFNRNQGETNLSEETSLSGEAIMFFIAVYF